MIVPRCRPRRAAWRRRCRGRWSRSGGCTVHKTGEVLGWLQMGSACRASGVGGRRSRERPGCRCRGCTARELGCGFRRGRGRRRMVPVRPRRDQTRRAGRRLGTAGTGRSGRPAGGPGGRGVRRSRVGGLEPSGGAEVGGEQVVGDESGCVRRPRRRRRAGRGGSCAGAVCRRLRRVRRAARSGLSSSAVSCSGVPAAPVRRAVLRSRGVPPVGRVWWAVWWGREHLCSGRGVG